MSSERNANENTLLEEKKIIYTGILDNFQRLNYLLKAFSKRRNHIHSSHLIIAANHCKKGLLFFFKNLSMQLGIKNSTNFYLNTAISLIPQLLKKGNVSVIPQPSYPGFPIKIFNYMGAKKAVVAFNGSAAILKNSYSAVLVENYNISQFVDEIIKYIKNSRFRAFIGENAKEALEKLKSKYLIRRIETVCGSLGC